MSLTSIFDIAGSGMSAQSVRLSTTASNIANAESASSSAGGVYRGRHPVFSASYNNLLGAPNNAQSASEESSVGVAVTDIVESDAPLQMRYEPNHPLADEKGYVYYPNVNVVEEMTNMISASRSFQTNVDVMNSAKQMMQRILTLGE
jgi:flagellar basal-body rod protein FlgC